MDGPIRRALTTLGLVLAFSLPCAAADHPPGAPKGELVHDRLASKALHGNLLHTPTERSDLVYLPPSYKTSPERRYPTLYLLHGITSNNTDFTGGADKRINIASELDRRIGNGTLREMILVLPDARTDLGDAFYTNSPVTGNWEDLTVRELVAHADATYRTLARPEARGIAGHSMGGYAAVKLAMKHPDVYAAAYAFSPACLAWAGDGNLKQLRGLCFEVGRRDQFSHIPASCRLLSNPLRAQGIRHTCEGYDGDHNDGVWERLTNHALPFFSETPRFAAH
jgi:S-formylglutathione hydrolase FrmB